MLDRKSLNMIQGNYVRLERGKKIRWRVHEDSWTLRLQVWLLVTRHLWKRIVSLAKGYGPWKIEEERWWRSWLTVENRNFITHQTFFDVRDFKISHTVYTWCNKNRFRFVTADMVSIQFWGYGDLYLDVLISECTLLTWLLGKEAQSCTVIYPE